MDLVQYLRSLAPEANEVDPEYLVRIKDMPQTMLLHEQTAVETSLSDIATTSEQLSAKHMKDFVDAKTLMDQIGDLSRDMTRASTEVIEASLTAPRASERVYTALRSLLANQVTVYLHIDRIQDLLSIPDLVKDCTVRGNYDEALKLAAMTDRLQKRYSGIRMVERLAEDVRLSMQSMRGVLLRWLKEESTPNVIAKAVNLLHRMETANLQTIYADSRWHFLQSQWLHIPEQLRKTQPFSYLKRFIEIYREHVYATIIGFYRYFRQGSESIEPYDETVLSRFARRALSNLLDTLREHAPRIEDPSDRLKLWIPLKFCSESLGRVGADFWSVLDESILSTKEWEDAHSEQQDMVRRNLRETTLQKSSLTTAG